MSSPEEERFAGWAAVAAGALIACHLGLVAYFAPRATLQSGVPILNDAFAIEAYRAFRAHWAFEAWGTLSGYDPTVLAGQTAGLTERFGTRIFVMSVIALSRLGVDPVRAFNGTIVALHAAVPVVAYASARAFRLGRGAALVTMATWIGLWFFDSLVHYAWFSGRIGWAVSCGVAVLFLGVGSRVAAGRSPRWAVVVVVLGVVAFVLHPVPALAGALLLAGFALGRRGVLPWRRALLASTALLPVLALFGMGPRSTALSSDPVVRLFDVGVGQAVWDVLEISSAGHRAPGATRTLLRVLVLVAGILGLIRLRAAADYRYAPLATATAAGVGIAYLGGYLPVRWPVDPYFFAAFGAFAATIPASFLLTDIEWRAVLASRLSRAVVLVTLFVAFPRWVRTVATYVPELLPVRVVRSTIDVMISPLVGVKEPLPDRFRHEAAPPPFAVVANFLAEHHAGRGNVLVDDPALAAYLSRTAALPVLGPLGERGSPAAAADPTPLFSDAVPPERVAEFLEDYAVGWVALWGAPSRFDLDDPLFEPIVRVAGVRVRRVAREPSFFVEGRGTVRSLSFGRLRVTTETDQADAGRGRPPRMTLRFHFDGSLRCRPGCRVASADARARDDVTPFVTIESPPAEFELFAP